ncbi:MAG TPA: succinyl-CoA--3-ketoacid-CoA transferase, partial [Synergistaceae bacterium]|nr:succinyl-CoA--3-ketoacid-CoA transferase [Synergistaceae bacterium]
VATRHFEKNGTSKLMKKCSLPLTGHGVVDVIVTEYCLVRNIKGRMILEEIAEGVDPAELQNRTEMRMDISHDLKTMTC